MKHAAVHRTILVTDIERYTDPNHTNLDQLAIRQGHYQIVRQAFARARVCWARCTTEDRGDGVLVLVPSDVPKARLAINLARQLDAALRQHNETCSAGTRIRLRVALHAGEVHYDDHGVAGNAINHTFRLAETPALKAALRASAGPLAIVASEWFYGEVIRHYPAADPEAYFRVRAGNAGAGARAWVRVWLAQGAQPFGGDGEGFFGWELDDLAADGVDEDAADQVVHIGG